MSPETVRKMFDLFFTTKQGTGTGLGTTVAWDLVRRNGGTIEVDSQEGEYTEVTVSLPAAPPAGQA